MRSITFLITLVVAAAAAAQTPTFVAQGDIAAAGNTQVRIMDRDGVSSTGYGVPISPKVILWDPSNPDDFIIGSGNTSPVGGVLARSSFAAPGTLVTTQIAAGTFGTPVQIGWDQTGQEIVVVTGADQVHTVHATTGAVTDLTTGNQAWGTDVSAGAMDPLTGDVYVATQSGDIWRLAAASGGVSLYMGGFGPIQKILFDSNASPHYMYVATTGAFHRVDISVPPVAEPFFGTFGLPSLPNQIRSFDFDENGDFIIAESRNVHRLTNVATIPPNGILPVFVGSYNYPNSAGFTLDVAVVGSTTTPFRLTINAIPPLGALFQIENVPEPLGRGWMFLSRATILPVGEGLFFGITIDALTAAIMALPPVPGGLPAFASPPPASYVVPPLGMAAFFGETWDGVAVALSPTGRFLGRSNVVRVTWQ